MDYDEDKDMLGEEVDVSAAFEDDSLFPVEELIDEDEPLHAGMKVDGDDDAVEPEEIDI